jgi:CBS domain-containing protein
MTTPSNYDLFMAAFNDIEAHLRAGAYGNPNDGPSGFSKALEAYRRKNSRRITEQVRREIETLADLRNALTHERSFKDQRLALPTDVAVQEIRRIRDLLLHPPSVLLALKLPSPVTVQPEARIGHALSLMREHDFSQLPVLGDKGEYLDLLTTNTIARWLGAQFQEHGGLAEEASVADVLKHREGSERVLLRGRGLTTIEAVREFVIAAESGEDLRAIILTQNGKVGEKPLGVVVTDDIARLADPRG